MAVHVILSPEVISYRNAKKYTAEHVVLPKTIKRIERGTFMRQERIKTIDFPDGLISIGESAFRDCIHIRKIYFPDALLSIGPEVCAGCRDLSFVRLSSSLREIPDQAFYKCRKLEQIDLPAGICSIGAEAFYFTGISELLLPPTVTAIKDRAFFRCSRLTYVKIPKNVLEIGMEAFHGCNHLKMLEISHDSIHLGERIVDRSVTIRCYEGSAVDDYCKRNEISTEYLVDKPEILC